VVSRAVLSALALSLPWSWGCQRERSEVPPPALNTAATSPAIDVEGLACASRVRQVRAQPALPGAPSYEEKRAHILGRARGEPVIWLREPRQNRALGDAGSQVERQPPFKRVESLKRRFARQPAELRQLVLREGYLYSADPIEALALVNRLELTDLFDEPELFLQRGTTVQRLRLEPGKRPRYVDDDGRTAKLLLADRIALTRQGLQRPLHRDLRRLAHELSFERARVQRQTEVAVLAELRFGGQWYTAVLEADGARLSLACIDGEKPERDRVKRFVAGEARRRAALSALRDAVDRTIQEALPFDRPREEETADRDGQLRPAWRWAYRAGQRGFVFEEKFYPVFDADGRPHPPQVCVDFVLDSYERASGTWYAPLGDKPERREGRLDFDDYELENRRAVLAFETFAQDNPALFAHLRFAGEQRIRFRERGRFFEFLVKHADLFRPGDVVAIQGLKNDGKIHQHAILIEDTDPVTGFPDALADQMRMPRQRSWEGIMAEAPLRSLLYRVRPTDKVLLTLAPPEPSALAQDD
jgi:hypothetical protein